MSHVETIQNCQVCLENSLRRGFIIRHTFVLCEKCNQAMNMLKKETDGSEWDKPWYSSNYIQKEGK